MTDSIHASTHTLERWGDLRYVLVCAESGSFSAAARILGVEQSTVSRRIAGLEAALGGALFTRTPEGVRCTPLGDVAYAEAELISQRMSALWNQAHGENDAPAGPVRLAMTESMALYVLLPGLQTIAEQYPKLRYVLLTGMYNSDLVRGEVDIALRFVRPERGDLVAKKVATLPQCVYASPSYWEKNKALSWEEHRWITLELPTIPVPERQWLAEHISAPPWLVTNSYQALIHAVDGGLGLGLMSASVQKTRPKLVRVEVPFPPSPPFSLWLVTHASLRHTARISAMWDALEALCVGNL